MEKQAEQRGHVLSKLHRKVFHPTAVVYLVFTSFLLLTGKEDLLILDTRGFLEINYACSESPSYNGNLNPQPVSWLRQLYDVRDNSLNGICSSATITFLYNMEAGFGSQFNDTCQFVGIDLDCDEDPAKLNQTLIDMWIQARRGDGNTLGIRCRVTDEICEHYNGVQAVCRASTTDRHTVNVIFGAVCLAALPLFFWSRHAYFLGFLPLFMWSWFGIFYKVEDECGEYSNQIVAYFALAISSLMLFVKLVLVIALMVLRLPLYDKKGDDGVL
jgi:hypothetical protein